METLKSKKPDWLDNDSFRPYVLLSPEQRITAPGSLHKFAWFNKEPLIINPLRMDCVEFANHVLLLDELMFSEADLGMPRWVFYDCAVLPGLVSGFAIKASALDAEMFDSALSSLCKRPPHRSWSVSFFSLRYSKDLCPSSSGSHREHP